MLLMLSRQYYQVLASQKLIWLHGNANFVSGSWWNPETWVLVRNLRCLIQCHRHGLTFFYFFINIKPMTLPSFSFAQADLAMWLYKLGVGAHDGNLKLWCSHTIWDISVHITQIDLLFLSVSLLTLNRWCCQFSASHKLIWLCGNAN